MPPTEDAADILAKEIITRICAAANKFASPKLRPGLGDALSGFRLPFGPLANQIRECAKKLYPTIAVEPVSPDEYLSEWFTKDTPVSASPGDSAPMRTSLTEPLQQVLDAQRGSDAAPGLPPVAKSADQTGSELDIGAITAALDGKPTRLSELATALKAEPAAILAIIEAPDSGLIVSGPAKWVKVAA